MSQRDFFFSLSLPFAPASGHHPCSGHSQPGARHLSAGHYHRLFLFLLIALVFSLGVWHPASLAQNHDSAANEFIEADHVRIRWLAPDQFAEDPAAQNATLGIYFEPDPEWHVYWRNPGDSGNTPRFKFESVNLKPGDILWPFPKRLPIAHLVNLGYEGEVAYLVKTGVEASEVRTDNPSPHTARLDVELEWLVCKEECIPGFGTLSLERPIRGENHLWQPETKALINHFQARIPAPENQSPWKITCAYWGNSGVLTLTLKPAKADTALADLSLPDIFPLQGEFVNPAAPEVHVNDGSLTVRFKTFPGVTPPETTGFVIVADELAWEFPSVVIHRGAFTDQEPSAFWWLLLSAFIGGVILNLMPCVFPVLSIKLFSLIRAPGQGDAQMAHRLREGLLYTAGVLTTFAVLGLIFLLLRAGGAAIGWGFQLQSPAVVLALVLLFWVMALSFLGSFEFGSRLMQLAGGRNSSSSFMTGVLAVFVAAPCTGPFMGAALGAAAVMSGPSAMAIFLGVGLGLAAPFLLLAVSPALSSRLPKPGPWMESLRQFFAFPLFATVLWLLWVLGQLVGDKGWVLGGTAVLLVSFAIWLGKSSRRFWRAIAAALALATVISAFIKLEPGEPARTASADIGWQPYSAEVIASARAEGKAVFIDFTAAWCITCQVNKKVVLDTDAADKLFSENDVLRIRADWTRYDADITEALAAFGRNSVPVYVYYPADGGQPEILPQVLTLDMIRDLF